MYSYEKAIVKKRAKPKFIKRKEIKSEKDLQQEKKEEIIKTQHLNDLGLKNIYYTREKSEIICDKIQKWKSEMQKIPKQQIRISDNLSKIEEKNLFILEMFKTYQRFSYEKSLIFDIILKLNNLYQQKYTSDVLKLY